MRGLVYAVMVLLWVSSVSEAGGRVVSRSVSRVETKTTTSHQRVSAPRRVTVTRAARRPTVLLFIDR